MIACKYRANRVKTSGHQKVIFMVSATMEDIEGRSEVSKLIAVKQYDVYMGGIDCVDQQLYSFQMLCKSYKLYKKLSCRLTLQMILNGHELFQKCKGNDTSSLSFMLNWIIFQAKKNFFSIFFQFSYKI